MFIRRVRLVPVIIRRPLVYFTLYSTASFAGVFLRANRPSVLFYWSAAIWLWCVVLYARCWIVSSFI